MKLNKYASCSNLYCAGTNKSNIITQAVLMESVEHLLVNLDLKNIAQKTLEIATENLKQDPHSQRSHACLFVRNKFFSMFSR